MHAETPLPLNMGYNLITAFHTTDAVQPTPLRLPLFASDRSFPFFGFLHFPVSASLDRHDARRTLMVPRKTTLDVDRVLP